MNKIYCLFSVANMYDQPPCNLLAWWNNPPTVEDLIGDISYSVDCVAEGIRLGGL